LLETLERRESAAVSKKRSWSGAGTNNLLNLQEKDLLVLLNLRAGRKSPKDLWAFRPGGGFLYVLGNCDFPKKVLGLTSGKSEVEFGARVLYERDKGAEAAGKSGALLVGGCRLERMRLSRD